MLSIAYCASIIFSSFDIRQMITSKMISTNIKWNAKLVQSIYMVYGIIINYWTFHLIYTLNETRKETVLLSQVGIYRIYWIDGSVWEVFHSKNCILNVESMENLKKLQNWVLNCHSIKWKKNFLFYARHEITKLFATYMIIKKKLLTYSVYGGIVAWRSIQWQQSTQFRASISIYHQTIKINGTNTSN